MGDSAETCWNMTPSGPLWRLSKSLDHESDRACALMVAAYLEDELQRLLKAYFVDDPKAVGKLFDPMGPLGTFSATITMAYALGLIGPNVRHDLDLIRRIRNDFAHLSESLTFETPSIRDRCKDLHFAKRIFGSVPGRKSYYKTFTTICGYLDGCISRLQPREVPCDTIHSPGGQEP
jgi:hypothetical protein